MIRKNFVSSILSRSYSLVFFVCLFFFFYLLLCCKITVLATYLAKGRSTRLWRWKDERSDDRRKWRRDDRIECLLKATGYGARFVYKTFPVSGRRSVSFISVGLLSRISFFFIFLFFSFLSSSIYLYFSFFYFILCLTHLSQLHIERRDIVNIP